MFMDEKRFSGVRFIEADLMAEGETDQVKTLKGKVDIINLAYVLHQWNWEGQVRAAKKVAEFTRKGSLIVGIQVGHVVEGERVARMMPIKQFRHTTESFQRMWREAGKEMGVEWKVEVQMKECGDLGWDERDYEWIEEGWRILEFVVERMD